MANEQIAAITATINKLIPLHRDRFEDKPLLVLKSVKPFGLDVNGELKTQDVFTFVELLILLGFKLLNVELIITFTIYYINEINVIFLLIIDYCSKFINYSKKNKNFGVKLQKKKRKMNIL